MRVYTALWMIHAIAPFVPTDDKEVMESRKDTRDQALEGIAKMNEENET